MRIRNIKPGFWTNEDLADCTDRQNLLFIGLWMLADKNGCLEFRPRRIKAELFALRDYTTEALQQDCERLAEALLIHFYRVSEGDEPTEACTAENADFIYIPNFIKHQQLTTWEKNQSKTDCPYPCHFYSTTEVLQPEEAEVGSKGEAEDTEEAEVGSPTSAASALLRKFQQAHPSCEKVGEQPFVAMIAACTTTEGRPDVLEAIEAFQRDMAGATLKFPLREFKKYLNHSSRQKHAEGSSKKNKQARIHPALQK